MKKTVVCLLVILLAGEFASASAAFIIKLKNGNYFLTERYWQDKAQVLFDSYGGVFGIDKGLVTSIEPTNKLINLLISAPDVQKERLLPAARASDNPSKAVVQNQLEDQTKGDQNDPVKRSFATLKEKMNGLDGMLTAEIVALLNEITAFKNMVAKNSKYFVQYGREFNDVQQMGALVETKLKSRDL
jgi:hypothetical protein